MRHGNAGLVCENTFQQIGQTSHPDWPSDIKIYEWTSPLSRTRPFSIRFLSPYTKGPRAFIPEAMFHHHFDGQPTSFLDTACAHGYAILEKDERYDFSKKRLYKLYRRLFRSREQGHEWNNRRFSRPIDLFRFANGQSPICLIPNIASPIEERQSGSRFSRSFQLIRQIAVDCNLTINDRLKPIDLSKFVCDASSIERRSVHHSTMPERAVDNVPKCT